MAERPDQFAGIVVITWPQPQGTALHGWAVTITDAVTGQPVRTVTSMDVHLHAAAEDVIWAECEIFADTDGAPILDGEPIVEHGGDPADRHVPVPGHGDARCGARRWLSPSPRPR